MTLYYTDQSLPDTASPSLFLAGPTPRSGTTPSWRAGAIQRLEELAFEGAIFVPEWSDGHHLMDAVDQFEWDQHAMALADLVVFWVPRTMAQLPGLTTNIEFGRCIESRPADVLYGRPEGADATLYLDWLYREHTGREPASELGALLGQAVDRLRRRARATAGRSISHAGLSLAPLPGRRPERFTAALDYAQLSVVPQLSEIHPDEVRLDTRITRKTSSSLPFIASPMDSVMSETLARELLDHGGVAIWPATTGQPDVATTIARLCDRETHDPSRLGLLLSPDPATWAPFRQFLGTQIALVALDTLHHKPHMHLQAIARLADEFAGLQIISGNVVTGRDCEALVAAGADAIRVGMTAASINRGRALLGCGRSQGAAVMECARATAGLDVPIIADGGIASVADAVIAFALGADSAMMGRMFAAIEESAATTSLDEAGVPIKRYRGMSRPGLISDELVAEGSERAIPLAGSFDQVVGEWTSAVRLAIARSGQRSLEHFRQAAWLERRS